jgi:hypothetical protein
MLGNNYKLMALVSTVCWLGLQGNMALADETIQTHDDSRLVSKLAERTQVLELELQRLQSQVTLLKRKQPKFAHWSQADVNIVASEHPIFIVGTPVISSPYIGINSEYNASDLVVNQPYVNEDLYLLQQQKQIFAYFHKNDYPIPTTPVVNLSGKIESQIFHTSHFDNFQNNAATDINLTGIELDTEILVNQWTTGLIAFVYDNSPPNMSPRRIDNSNVFLERGFLTIGNLAKFPMYGTIGQFYVPFGQYSSAMISDPFTKTLGRTKARAVALGFSKKFDAENNLNLAAFVFRGPSRTSIENRGLHNYGANVDYTFTKPKWNIDVAGSYIRSIADALGMQHNGNSEAPGNFRGFATNEATELLNPVPGVDTRGTLGIGAFSLTGEYVTASRSFSQKVLSFDERGAKPAAFHTEAAYKFNVLEKPSAVIIGYDQSKDALGLLIPKKRYIATVSTSIWKDTIESLEFRHDIDYSVTDVAIGQRLNPINGTGKSGNTLTLQIGLYF